MDKKHEQSVIDAFLNYLKKQSENIGKDFISASLDGQDNLFGADYIFTNSIKFVLSEFKYEENNIVAENQKPKRLYMCEKLECDTVNKNRHDLCHYIAWSKSTEDKKRTIVFNKYFDEVCNLKIWNNSNLTESMPKTNSRIPVNKFVDNFLHQKIGLEFHEFNLYIDWLLKSTTGTGTMELLIGDYELNQFRMIEFDSLQELKNWMDERSPKQEQKRKPKDNGPSRRGPSL